MIEENIKCKNVKGRHIYMKMQAPSLSMLREDILNFCQYGTVGTVQNPFSPFKNYLVTVLGFTSGYTKFSNPDLGSKRPRIRIRN
jgi:hypothetical protein